MTRRWIDPDGHAWPVTGHTCSACGLPLTQHRPGQESHPACDQEAAS